MIRMSESEYSESDDEINEEEQHILRETQFEILGEAPHVPTNKIAVTSSWIKAATTFPIHLDRDLHAADELKDIPEEMMERIKENIPSLFPVQFAVLPVLIQDLVSPPVLRRKDIAIASPTGSGKTLCFVIPSLMAIGPNPSGVVCTLVVLPVQALVLQIEKEFNKFNVFGANIIALTGADKSTKFLKSFSSTDKCDCDVLITTPSRLLDLLVGESNPFNLNSMRYLVVDEADQMGMKVRLEWLDLLEKRYGETNTSCNLRNTLAGKTCPQKILLSATISRDIEELHLWNLHNPAFFKAATEEVDPVALETSYFVAGKALCLPSTIVHYFVSTPPKFFPLVVYDEIIKRRYQKVLIFTKEKDSSHRLYRFLEHLSKGTFHTANLNSNVYANRLGKIIEKFESGNTRVLICTDVLARGVDIANVDCVVNYDLPMMDRLFIHRAGRTGRAGRLGYVMSLGHLDTERRYLHMLRKMKLDQGMVHKKVTEEELVDLMPEYEEALEKLQHEMMMKGVAPIRKEVSGRKYARRRRWEPEAREKKKVQEETAEKLRQLRAMRD